LKYILTDIDRVHCSVEGWEVYIRKDRAHCSGENLSCFAKNGSGSALGNRKSKREL
jgi:hypothetical protein